MNLAVGYSTLSLLVDIGKVWLTYEYSGKAPIGIRVRLGCLQSHFVLSCCLLHTHNLVSLLCTTDLDQLFKSLSIASIAMEVFTLVASTIYGITLR